MKPTAPLRAHNTRKTSISPAQRRHRFQASTHTGPQRRWRFQPGNASHRIGKQCTRSHTIVLATRQCTTPVSSTMPLSNKLNHGKGHSPNSACNSIGLSFNNVRKRCNSNGVNSKFERAAGELHAKSLRRSYSWASGQRAEQHQPRRFLRCARRRRNRRARHPENPRRHTATAGAAQQHVVSYNLLLTERR